MSEQLSLCTWVHFNHFHYLIWETLSVCAFLSIMPLANPNQFYIKKNEVRGREREMAWVQCKWYWSIAGGGPSTVKQWSCQVNEINSYTRHKTTSSGKRDFLFKTAVRRETKIHKVLSHVRQMLWSCSTTKESETKPVSHVLKKINTGIETMIFEMLAYDYMTQELRLKSELSSSKSINLKSLKWIIVISPYIWLSAPFSL